NVAAARDLFREVRRRLSEEERRLMDLRYQGSSWAEIAAAVGGQTDAVRVRLGRGPAPGPDGAGAPGRPRGAARPGRGVFGRPAGAAPPGGRAYPPPGSRLRAPTYEEFER